MEVQCEWLNVVIEPELAHGPKHILGSDSLALLALAALVGFPSDEADVLGHTFLDGLFGIIRDLGVWREDLAHDPYHVRDRHEPVLFSHRAFVVVCGGCGGGDGGVVHLC